MLMNGHKNRGLRKLDETKKHTGEEADGEQ